MQKYEIIDDKFNLNIICKLKSSNNNDYAGSEVLTDVLLKIRASEASTTITRVQTGYAYETQNDTYGSW